MMQQTTRSAGLWRKMTDKEHVGYLFIFPAVLIISLFVIVPLIVSFIIALFDLDSFFKVFRFTGAENLLRTFTDGRVWNAFKNTFFYVAVTVPIQLSLALFLGFLLYRPTVFNKLCRSVYYVPVLCSFTAIGILFNLMLNPTVGYIPYFLTLFGGEASALLSDPKYAMAVVVFISVWKIFGKSMIIYVAGINDIPATYFEASAIDGASRAQEFFHITIPNLLPTISFTLLTTIIYSFQVFDVVYVTTGGGPLFKTETLVQYIYLCGFSFDNELGYASAISVELFLIIAAIVLFFKGYLDRKIEGTY